MLGRTDWGARRNENLTVDGGITSAVPEDSGISDGARDGRSWQAESRLLQLFMPEMETDIESLKARGMCTHGNSLQYAAVSQRTQTDALVGEVIAVGHGGVAQHTANITASSAQNLYSLSSERSLCACSLSWHGESQAILSSGLEEPAS